MLVKWFGIVVSWYQSMEVPVTNDHQNPRAGGKDGETGKPVKVFHIRIDRTGFEVKEETLTGLQLRNLPTPPIGPDRDLFEVVPGGSDLKIENDMAVKMRDGLRFFTAPAQINPGLR